MFPFGLGVGFDHPHVCPGHLPRRLFEDLGQLDSSDEQPPTMPIPPMFNEDYFRAKPARYPTVAASVFAASIKSGKNKFQVFLDVQHFAPEEISVNVVDDGFVVVEAKHEEKMDQHGYISRQFLRRFPLPDGIDLASIDTRLSSDGVLCIFAPRKAPEPKKGEHPVPIMHTGPVRKEVNFNGVLPHDRKKK